LLKILRFTRSQNVPNFGMKCSKSCRFLELRPGELTTLPPDPLVARSFLPSAIAASRLWRSQFDLLARSDIGTPPYRSQFFPPGSSYSIPGSDPVHEVWGVDKLWIFLYTLSTPNLCLWALCYFHESSFWLIKTSPTIFSI